MRWLFRVEWKVLVFFHHEDLASLAKTRSRKVKTIASIHLLGSDFIDPLDLIDTLQNIQYLACIMPRNVQPYCL